MTKPESEDYQLTKTALSLVTGIGIGAIVSSAVSSVIPAHYRLPMRICVYVGKFGISSAIGAAVDKNNNANIDYMFNMFKAVTTTEED